MEFYIMRHKLQILWECYPDALKKIYNKQVCSLYYVSKEGFLSDKTSWDTELVNPNAVSVICEERITNIYQKLIDAQKQKYKH